MIAKEMEKDPSGENEQNHEDSAQMDDQREKQ